MLKAPSFQRRPESSLRAWYWIPAFAGMTIHGEVFAKNATSADLIAKRLA